LKFERGPGKPTTESTRFSLKLQRADEIKLLFACALGCMRRAGFPIRR